MSVHSSGWSLPARFAAAPEASRPTGALRRLTRPVVGVLLRLGLALAIVVAAGVLAPILADPARQPTANLGIATPHP